jgi:DNA-binding transcriptional ArsR family regulator
MARDPLSATLSALADPTRRAILARLATGQATVNELAEPFHISLPAISRHLRVLESAGLISRGREAQWRPCVLQPAGLRTLDGWLEPYRRFWSGSFDKLDSYIAELKSNEPKRTELKRTELERTEPKAKEKKPHERKRRR